jgi:hypothetical protein
VATALGGAALAVGLVAMPAAATPTHSPAGFDPQHATSAHHPQVGGNFNQDGGNWSGYVATGSGFSSVSANWTIPNVTCNSSNDLFAPWVGLDGYGSQSVEQTGVAVDCSSGSPVDQAWYEMYPDNPVYYNDPVSAGDAFSGSVTTDGGGNYTLTITDSTKGWTETKSASYNGANASAEAILESPSAAYPNFGSLSFSSFEINGQSADSAAPVALDASNSNGYEDHTGALSGGSFSVSYEQE